MHLNYEDTGRGIVLEENVFLASVRVSMYDPEKKDSAASIELADAKNASRRKTKVKKRVLDDAFPTTRRIASQIRDVHYRLTAALPRNGKGQQKGPRLLPSRLAESYLDQVTDLIDQFGHAAGCGACKHHHRCMIQRDFGVKYRQSGKTNDAADHEEGQCAFQRSSVDQTYATKTAAHDGGGWVSKSEDNDCESGE